MPPTPNAAFRVVRFRVLCVPSIGRTALVIVRTDPTTTINRVILFERGLGYGARQP